ncbi:protein kinase domain-containing protein [Rubrivirga sp.]|uniref:serine/threonine protein kinase n=1 Tax=Rubrivirga sp. TaxID=1885344 RepID=UPI003C745EB1
MTIDPTPERWSLVRDTFDAVADLPIGDRPSALEAACVRPDGTLDTDLRLEVEAMLAADDAASVLDESVPAELVEDEPSAAGEEFGRWRVQREVGRGGMGAVYLVERSDGTYDQTAALKRLSIFGAEGVRQFERERQILAGLEHPGIARLIDGGVRDDVPFLVMEYVEGEPITVYADAHGLEVEDRVRLFVQVCEAVGYAHRHLVVHRDLKPGNVFVTERERGGRRPVLLDFGVAKMLDVEGDTATTMTAMPHLTPEYAAPEQVTGEPVTTATDVYALGVLLYELLAGQRPYEIERPTLTRIVEAVVDTRPARPSSVAPAVQRVLRGDLDTVVMKALDKDPARRYISADDLADDLRRYLDGLPVRARAPSVSYRAQRFVGRHRVSVAASALAVLMLVAGTVFYTVRLAAERDRAEQAAQDAQREALQAERTAEFLESLFASSDPTGADPGERTARQLLDAGAAQARDDLEGEPGILASMLATMGRAYRTLGDYETAGPLLEDAVELYQTVGDDPLGQRDALLQLANLRYRTEDYGATEALALQALALDSLHATDGEERLAILNTLALSYSDTDRPEEAAQLLTQVIGGRRALEGDEAKTDLATNLGNLGLILLELERTDEAETLLDEALELHRDTRGPDHPYVAFVLNSRAGIHETRGDIPLALADLRQAEEIGVAAFGPDHPFVEHVKGHLGRLQR